MSCRSGSPQKTVVLAVDPDIWPDPRSRTILVVDEPPMGSDVYPDKPEDGAGWLQLYKIPINISHFYIFSHEIKIHPMFTSSCMILDGWRNFRTVSQCYSRWMGPFFIFIHHTWVYNHSSCPWIAWIRNIDIVWYSCIYRYSTNKNHSAIVNCSV